MSGARKPVAKPRFWYYKVLRVAKTQLGMSEDEYRSVLEFYGAKDKDGKASATTLSIPKLEQVLEHFKKLGFKTRPTGTKKSFRDGQIGKCKKLWCLMHEHGIMRAPYSEARLSKFAFKITGVNNVRWATSTNLASTIEALKSMAQREGIQ